MNIVINRPQPARRILLESAAHTGSVRYLTGLHVSLQDNKTSSWVTITRTGKFRDPRYGEFEISREMLLSMVRNFEARTYGQDIFIDVSHRPDQGAAGKVLKLSIEGERLRAYVEWTPYGIAAIREHGFQYLSAEYHENWRDNEAGNAHGAVLLGAGLTVRPVIKRLDPVMLAESTGPVLIHHELQTKLISELHMNKAVLLAALAVSLGELKLAQPVIDQWMKLAGAAIEPLTEETQVRAVLDSYQAAGRTLSEQLATGTRDVNIQLSAPAGLDAAGVRRLLAEERDREAATAKEVADRLAANRKALADQIAAAKGLDPALVKRLTDEAADLVTADLTADQITRLAENQIRHGNEIAAARQLSSMGYQLPAGAVRITVDSSNEVLALQEVVDRRMGFDRMTPSRRYARTGGQLQTANKEFADLVLAQFDADQGRRLHSEHRSLAGGDSVISDVAVPAIFERTVIREALYQLIGLQFVDVGTYPFSGTAQIPYSFRDTAAAGRSGTRKYEGQGVARAAVKQAMQTFYPLPQKLAFEVSDELRYLTQNGQLDWDAVAENTRNASRVIGEDTEKIIFDEVLNGADEFLVTAVVSEALTNVNGTNKIFALTQFPVVRPRKTFDLQGTQVGSTLNPITVTYAAVVRNEYDGSNTQASGTYYTLDYNLGEIRFVTELGAAVVPPNATAITVSYTYTTNVAKFDTDLGSLSTDQKWDDFLYRMGLRKNVIESDRYYMANFGLMSGTVRTQIEQARSFVANYQRNGTDLAQDGNLGRIKDVAQYRSTAPGLNMGDTRVLIGERGYTRFRMMKPWAMGQMLDQRDSNGRFTGKKEAFGDQFVLCGTPTLLAGSISSLVLYSSSGRVNRVS